MESKDFIIPKGFCKELIFEENDNELKKVSQEFIDILDEENEKYIKEKEKQEKKYKKYVNNKKYFFEPEILCRRSPLTIIDAPWGNGKTFFIENLIKLVIEKEINFKNFKNIIIIDAWKYSNSKNIPDEIMSELFLILSNKNNKIKKYFLISSARFFNTVGNPWIKKFGIEIKKINKKKIKQKIFEKCLKKIAEKNEKTIIFFDNIERIGKKSQEILKSIFKIQQFDNFVFILPMNIKKLEKDNKENGEYPIEKFIDIKYFKLKQNYLNFLKNKSFLEEEAKKINEILNTEIDGKKLSIREVKQRFESNNILKIEDEIERSKIIINKIWPAKEKFKSLFLSPKIEIFYKNLNSAKEIFNEFKNILTKKNEGFYLNQNIYAYKFGKIKKEYDLLSSFEKNLWNFSSFFDKKIFNNIEFFLSKKDENLNLDIKKLKELKNKYEIEINKYEIEKNKIKNLIEKISKKNKIDINNKINFINQVSNEILEEFLN